MIEYKSPEDGLSVDDYYKAMGYACLYKSLGESVGQIPTAELTVSFFREQYPRKLFAQLKREGCTVEEKFPGIFYVRGRLPFDSQVVVTSRLEPGRHLGLKMLSRHVSEADARAFIEKSRIYTEPGDRNNAEAVLQVSVPANRKIYDGIRRAWSMNEVLRDWLKEDIDRIVAEEVEKIIDTEMEKRMDAEVGRRVNAEVEKRMDAEVGKRVDAEVEKRMDAEVGRRVDAEVEKRMDAEVGRRLDEETENTVLTYLRNLMKNTKWTAEQAMAAVSIPLTDRARYASRL